MTEAVTIWLPFPPTTNNLFANGTRGRFPSKAYTAWKQKADAALAQQRAEPLPGPVHLTISLTPPTKALRDCSNYCKAVEDFIVARGIIPGDDYRYVRSITSIWAIPPAEHPGAVVEIREAG